MPGPSTFSRAVGLQQQKRECSGVFLEASGFGTDPALLWPSAKAASLGSKWAMKGGLKPEKDGLRLVHRGGVKTEYSCALCSLKLDLGCYKVSPSHHTSDNQTVFVLFP